MSDPLLICSVKMASMLLNTHRKFELNSENMIIINDLVKGPMKKDQRNSELFIEDLSIFTI